jgi:hypothetical protein
MKINKLIGYTTRESALRAALTLKGQANETKPLRG